MTKPVVRAVLLLGPTGAGKTPFGEYLEKRSLDGRKCFHFDFGHQLRAISACDCPPEGFDGKEHSFIRDVLDKGVLLEREHFPLAGKIVNSFLRRCRFAGGDTLVLNGLPRHVEQARDMDEMVAIESLIVLECNAEDVRDRVRSNVGGDRTDRSDDSIEMVQKKLEIYKIRTAPLIDYYADKGCSIVRIEVLRGSTAEDMYSNLF